MTDLEFFRVGIDCGNLDQSRLLDGPASGEKRTKRGDNEMAGVNGMIHKEKHQINDETLDRAKAECRFSDRLYEILLAYQNGQGLGGRASSAVPTGNVGELNFRMSHLYNLIWCAALDMSNQKGQPKKKQKQEVVN